MIRAIAKGIGGSGSGLAGWIVASIDQIDATIRVAAGALGGLVALATLVSVCLDIRRKWRHRND